MKKTRKFNLNDLPAKIITASVQSDTGCVREANEDNGRHIRPNDPETQQRKGILTIVADGMGGHASGEVASEMAVELIGKIYYENTVSVSAPEALRNAIEQASHQIYETSQTDKKYLGMGTTLVALVLLNDKAFTAHVGDSRIYRLRGLEMEMLTLDHSQVMEMVKCGVLSMEEARHHDDKNVILRAVGTQPTVEVEVSAPFAVETGDEFLLCSDGLSDMVEDTEIRQIWLSTHDAYSTAEMLISKAKQHGGHDNVTVGIIRVAAAETAAAANGKVRVTRETEVLTQ